MKTNFLYVLVGLMVLAILGSVFYFSYSSIQPDTRTSQQKRDDFYYYCVRTKVAWSQNISECDNIK